MGLPVHLRKGVHGTMEINKLGSAEEYRQLAAQRQGKTTQQAQTKEEQTVSIAGAAKTMPAKAPPPSGEAPKEQGGGAGQGQAAQTTATQQSASVVSSLTAGDDDDSDYQTIANKVDSGQALTESELATLCAKDPARYSRALRARTARETLHREMEQSPNNAGRAAREAIASVQSDANQAAAAQAHGGIAAEDADALVRALNDEYTSFAKQYDQVEISRPMAEE